MSAQARSLRGRRHRPTLRIRILRPPTSQWVDAIRLDNFRVGQTYDVGHAVGAYLLAEGWAEPADLAAEKDLFAEGNPNVDWTVPMPREGEPPAFDIPSPPSERRSSDRRRMPDRRDTPSAGRRKYDRRLNDRLLRRRK